MDDNQNPSHDSQKGASLKGLSIAWVTLTGVTVILRFWSRSTNPTTKKRFGADDWMALACWPVIATFDLCVYEWKNKGMGQHITAVSMQNVHEGLKLTYAIYITYNFGITMARFSALLLYARIFEPHRRSSYRYFLWAGFGLNTAWIIAFGVIGIMPCTPLHAFWDRIKMNPSTYTCPNLPLQLASGISSVLVDLVVLLLPIQPILKLQLSARTKVRIALVFFMGYCVIVFTIGRLIAIVKAGKTLNNDITWAFVSPLYWYECEVSVASISISLPVIFRLFQRALRHGPSALVNSKEYPVGSSLPTAVKRGIEDDGFVRLTNKIQNRQEPEVHLDTLNLEQL